MDALDLIKEDHKRLKKLLKDTLEAEGSQREHAMDHLRTELVAHERMEEEVLYPRLRDENKARQEVLEGYEEHHVADHVNRSALSGSTWRCTSTRPRLMIRSMSARSSGSWPIARGLRSFGWTSMSVRATFRSPHMTSGRPVAWNADA